MLKHRTFKGNLYELMIARHLRRRDAVMGAIACLESLSDDLPSQVTTLTQQLKEELESALEGDPPAVWKSAVGLTVSAEVDRYESESFGDYLLTVVAVDTHPYFKCVVSGPKGLAEWWPGCGRSETETMVSVGAWRHTIRRFFGLEAKGGS